jgi:hypothetical protein
MDTRDPQKFDQAIQCVAICVLILYIKMWFAANKAASKRLAAGITYNKEDAALLSNDKRKVGKSPAQFCS